MWINYLQQPLTINLARKFNQVLIYEVAGCEFKMEKLVALWLQKPPKNKIIHRIRRIPIQYVAQNKTLRYKI